MTFTPETMMPVILQRLAGNLTAIQAAQQVGVSRKTYYQWEERALQGMQAALSPGRTGRPPSKPETALACLEAQNHQLRQQVELLEQRVRAREVLTSADTVAKKK